jgi:hypothetical protein
VSTVSKRASLLGPVIVCLLVAGCGGGGSSRSGDAHIPGKPATQAGFTTYSGKGFQLSVPGAWQPFSSRSPAGLVSVGWSTPRTGNFVISTTYDPHPVSFASAVAAETHVSQVAYHTAKHSIVSAQVPGARTAKLFTFSGPHGVGPYRDQPQRDADLIVSTPGGAMIEVQVVSHGQSSPDPMAVINSFRLQ